MVFFLYVLPRFISKSAALRVGQEDRDLGVQSRLEPWSPIKRLAVAGSQAVASVCQHRSHPLIHTVTSLWWLYMLHLRSWIQQLSDYPWIIHKIHSPFMECCGCSSPYCCKLECCITVCHGWSQSKVGSRTGGHGDRGCFRYYLFFFMHRAF